VISFRYHLISVVAIFLALAIGVAVGTTALNGAVLGDLRHQVSDLKATNQRQAGQLGSLAATSGNADQLAQVYGSKITAGTLAGSGVVLLAAPGTSPTLLSALSTQITAAGATVSAQIGLTAALSDPAQSASVLALATSAHPIGLTLPTQTSDPGTLAGSLLGYVLFGKGQPTDLATVLAAFAKSNLITVSGTPAAGKIVLLVAPGAKPAGDPATGMLSLLSTEMATYGPTVVAGDSDSATAGGLVAQLRSTAAAKTALSTVDDVDTPLGQLSTVLALSATAAGHKGQYGTAAGVDGLLPAAGS
jgi:hypothetical protein